MEYSQSMLLLLLLVSTIGFFYERSREDIYNQLMQMQQKHHDEQQLQQQLHQQCHDQQQQLQQQLKQIQEDLQQHNIKLQHVQEELKQQREHNEGMRGGCHDNNIEGLTKIYFQNKPLPVPCDGEGGIVILRRVDDKYNFPGKLWDDYKHGFGDPSGSFWLGLEHIHKLTSLSEFALRVELKFEDGEVRFGRYEYVQVMDESSGYQLMVYGYSGNVADCLSYNNGMKFTTIDRDNDEWIEGNCAALGGGGWWHKYFCSLSFLTRPYTDGILWNFLQYTSAKMTLVMR